MVIAQLLMKIISNLNVRARQALDVLNQFQQYVFHIAIYTIPTFKVSQLRFSPSQKVI